MSISSTVAAARKIAVPQPLRGSSRCHGRGQRREAAARASSVGWGHRASAAPGRRRHVPTLRTSAADAAAPAASTYSRDLSLAPRLIQHKNEAFWFYRYLSIVYDHIVNPGHWTEDMREDSLSVAKLDSPDLKARPPPISPRDLKKPVPKDPSPRTHVGPYSSVSDIQRLQVVDVGGGTGFCTLGIVKSIDAKNVTLIDQSPHQLAKAKAKTQLKDVTIMQVFLSCLFP